MSVQKKTKFTLRSTGDFKLIIYVALPAYQNIASPSTGFFLNMSDGHNNYVLARPDMRRDR